MTAYLLHRLASGLLTLAVASVAVFSALEILPGNPSSQPRSTGFRTVEKFSRSHFFEHFESTAYAILQASRPAFSSHPYKPDGYLSSLLPREHRS